MSTFDKDMRYYGKNSGLLWVFLFPPLTVIFYIEFNPTRLTNQYGII